MSANRKQILLVSMHNHSAFSNGSASLEEMLAYAYAHAVTHYAVTDHSYNDVYANGSLSKQNPGAYFLQACLLCASGESACGCDSHQ